jgi:hypothetical protein
MHDIPKCTSKLSKDALSLINRQRAEIEGLRSDLGIWKDIAHRETGYVKIAKSEAVNEFAERLKKECVQDGAFGYVSAYDIDNLVTEMVGGNDDL